MKILKKFFWLIFALIVSGFGAFPAYSEPTTYIVEQSTTSPTTLIVHVNRSSQHSATQLILRGVSMGIASQVQNVTCDGRIIKEEKLGTWPISKDCRELSWQISLLESGYDTAGKQQSLKSGNFILLSEPSSLPRLQNTDEPATLKVAIPDVKTLFPEPDLIGAIPLPKLSVAPFYILINPILVDSLTSGSIKLTYYIDDQKSVAALPSVAAHMSGLKWLNEVIPSGNEENFTIAWLGISKNKMGMGGAAGEDVLLANYPNDGDLKFGNAMLLYVALHEAFHQFAMHYPIQPNWVAESLAAYYGARAVIIALPNDSRSYALMERFEADGDQFTDGLLAINRKVQNGDRSEYGAFYTKGLAFWAAVDMALQQQGDNLDRHITEILQAKYDSNGEPVDMQQILGLTQDAWRALNHRFLD